MRNVGREKTNAATNTGKRMGERKREPGAGSGKSFSPVGRRVISGQLEEPRERGGVFNDRLRCWFLGRLIDGVTPIENTAERKIEEGCQR